MICKIIEVTNGFNWGKFMLCRFDAQEWQIKSVVDTEKNLLQTIGWAPHHIWILDLQTGEGALFRPGGVPQADLKKHKIWVCPMYEPFMVWLYSQDLSDIEKLPSFVELQFAESALYGYRREGPVEKSQTSRKRA